MYLFLALLLVVLNVIDACFTQYFVEIYQTSAVELNPLMRFLINQSIELFWVVKMIASSLSAIFLYILSKSELSGRIGLWIINCLYFGVLLWHVYQNQLLN